MLKMRIPWQRDHIVFVSVFLINNNRMTIRLRPQLKSREELERARVNNTRAPVNPQHIRVCHKMQQTLQVQSVIATHVNRAHKFSYVFLAIQPVVERPMCLSR